MDNTRAVAIDKTRTNSLVAWMSILGLALLAPLFPLQQISGPIVNALLFIAVLILGLKQTLPICFMPSIMALSAGLLPWLLAPIVPFIMLSNVILVIVFAYTYEKNFWWGVLAASLLKFIFIWSTTAAVANLIIKKPQAIKAVAMMMSWPQLFSALAGGVIAYFVLKFIKRI